jgi:hypothetical protein
MAPIRSRDWDLFYSQFAFRCPKPPTPNSDTAAGRCVAGLQAQSEFANSYNENSCNAMGVTRDLR